MISQSVIHFHGTISLQDPPGTSEFTKPTVLRGLIGPCLLFVFVITLYAPSTRNDFVFDDHILIVTQPKPYSAMDFLDSFSEPMDDTLPYYRPIAKLTMLVQKRLHDNNPQPYHWFNVILIGIISLQVSAFLRLPAIGVHEGPALLAAALFATHPTVSSCVYPICSGRETMLGAGAILAGIYAFGRSGPGWYLLGLVWLIVALGCKELGIILPFLWIFSDVLGLSANRPSRPSQWVYRYTPVVIITTGYLVIRSEVLSSADTTQLVLFERPMGLLISWMYLAQTLFAPFLELHYEPRFAIWFSPWRLMVWPLCIIALVIGTFRIWLRTWRAVIFWLSLSFFGAVLTSNILDQEAFFAERYGFLTLVGVLGIASTIVSTWWSNKRWKCFTVITMLATIVFFGVISYHRGQYYNGDENFYQQMLASDPQSSDAHTGMGIILSKQQKHDKALTHLNYALKLQPNQSEILKHIANTYQEHGQHENAISYYRKAIQINPDMPEVYNNICTALMDLGRLDEAMTHCTQAINIKPHDAVGLYNNGNVHRLQGRLDQAVDLYERSLDIDRDFAPAHNNLGLVLAAQGRTTAAIQHYQRAIELGPSDANYHVNLANAFMEQQDVEQAIMQYKKGLSIDSQNAHGHYNIALALDQLDRKNQAIHHYQQAISANPDYARAHHNLALILEATGEFEQAMQHFRHALRITPNMKETRLNMGMLLVRRGQFQDAIAELDGLVAMASKWEPGLRLLSWAVIHQPSPNGSDITRAVMLAQQAVELATTDKAMSLFNLADVYAAAGQIEASLDAARASQDAINESTPQILRGHIQQHITSLTEFPIQNPDIEKP
tara:strand:+ start:852 stop:3362 length:2511 start_codon:yes stop_codon:yes gene_type:complete